MTRPIIGAHAECSTHWSRTQREAGIEFKQWEDRLAATRPWAYDVITFVCLVGFGFAGFYAAQHISDLLKFLG